MPAFTRNSLVVVQKEEMEKKFSEWYDLDDVQEMYGGKLKDIENTFWPPDMQGSKQNLLKTYEVNKILENNLATKKVEL